MIIASSLFSINSMSDTWNKSYAKRNKVYESCTGVKPSAKIKAKNAIKAIGFTLATEINKSTIVDH